MAVGTFVYQGSPQRVIFGRANLARVSEEVERLGLQRALVISTPEQTAEAARVATALGPRCAATFTRARMHTPVDVTDEAMALVTARQIDGTVAIGGGSTIGLGKAIALRLDLPQVVIPTTYAGSEATNILGETSGGTKKTVRDPKVLPDVIVYDVDLTLTLPVPLSVASGMNAIAHAVEGLYAQDGNPVLSLMAEDGIRALARALPVLASNPTDANARADALYGAWLCSTVLGGTSMALHHKICHVLGGTFDLPHADAHAIVLPHVVRVNTPAAPEAIARVARALDAASAPARLFDLAACGGGPTALKQVGMPEAGLDRAADLVTTGAYANPRQVSRDEVRALLDDAWRGVRPD